MHVGAISKQTCYPSRTSYNQVQAKNQQLKTNSTTFNRAHDGRITEAGFNELGELEIRTQSLYATDTGVTYIIDKDGNAKSCGWWSQKERDIKGSFIDIYNKAKSARLNHEGKLSARMARKLLDEFDKKISYEDYNNG